VYYRVPVNEVGAAEGRRWNGHILLLYATEQHRTASVSAWVRSGLAQGDKVLYAQVPGDLGFLRTLEERGLDVDAATSSGQLTVLAPDDFFPDSGQEPLVDRALDEGYPAVRFSAQADLALSYLSQARHREVEAGMEELCTTRPVSAMCQYDAAGSRLSQLVDAVSCHPRLVDHDELRMHQRDDRLLLEGEASLVSSTMLELALERACTESRTGSLSVDLSGLDFIDVAGCRALLLGTAGFREGGGHLFLERPQPHVKRTLRLLGAERLGQVFLVT